MQGENEKFYVLKRLKKNKIQYIKVQIIYITEYVLEKKKCFIAPVVKCGGLEVFLLSAVIQPDDRRQE